MGPSRVLNFLLQKTKKPLSPSRDNGLWLFELDFLAPAAIRSWRAK